VVALRLFYAIAGATQLGTDELSHVTEGAFNVGYQERENFSTRPSTFERNNKLIKMDGKSIYYRNYVKAEIIFCNQMLFYQNNLESYNSAKYIGLLHTNFLTWSGIRSGIPVHLKNLNVEESVRKKSLIL